MAVGAAQDTPPHHPHPAPAPVEVQLGGQAPAGGPLGVSLQASQRAQEAGHLYL